MAQRRKTPAPWVQQKVHTVASGTAGNMFVTLVVSLSCTWSTVALHLSSRSAKDDGASPTSVLEGTSGSASQGHISVSDTEFLEPTEASQEWLTEEFRRFREAESI